MLKRSRYGGMKFVFVCLLIGLIGIGLSACVPLVEPVGDAQVEGAQPEAVETEDAVTEPSELTGILTGTVTYLQRVALPPGSVIDVQLQDVSRADAPAQILASQTITTAGENVPIPFTLSYDPAQVDERFTYALSVSITTDGQLRWINTQQYAVLTRGAPLSEVEVVLQPVQ